MANKSDKERYIAENSEYSFDEDLFTFSLVDASTVDRLRRDGDIDLPKRKVNVPKDERWNTKQMASKLMQGILNGDSIPKISESLLDVIHNNDVSATRAARTLVTQAENHGRLDSYKTLDEQGVVQEKVWIATPDSRTRESHIDVDGERVGINDTFSNGLEYPADPSGDPAEVYNCRCSMRTEIVGFRRADGSISMVDYERDDTMHEGQMDEESGRRGIEPKDIGKITNKFGKEILFDFNNDKHDKQIDILKILSSDYDTRLEKVTSGAKQAAGDVDISGSIMRLSSSMESDAIHEFAHTLANTDADKYGLTNDTEFWKEIKKVRREYMRDVGADSTRWISVYEHSHQKVDEFFAEAFTHAKAREMGIILPDNYGKDFTYSQKVLAIIDKYFKRKK